MRDSRQSKSTVNVKEHASSVNTARMPSDVEKLARWRTLGARYSEQVIDLAPRVLRSSGLGDQGMSMSSDSRTDD